MFIRCYSVFGVPWNLNVIWISRFMFIQPFFNSAKFIYASFVRYPQVCNLYACSTVLELVKNCVSVVKICIFQMTFRIKSRKYRHAYNMIGFRVLKLNFNVRLPKLYTIKCFRISNKRTIKIETQIITVVFFFFSVLNN